MMRHLFVSLSTLALTWAGASSAYACPSDYSSYACDEGGVDVCEDEGTTVLECHLTINGETAGGTLTMVGNYDTGSDYSAWGTDSGGNNFCCMISSKDIDTVVVEGGDYDDTISFTYTSGGTTWNLSNRGSSSRLTGFATGGQGDDTLTGSKNAGAYLDSLLGDEGNDTINGNLGADEISGGPGDDLLYGGGSADIIHGGDGVDTVYGEAGNDNITGDAEDDYLDGGGDADYINGGLGNDVIAGQGGTDTLTGTNGNDTICGGSGLDHLCGGADDDQVWGDAGTDCVMGMTGTDACSGEHADTCESTLSAKPSACP